MFSTYVVPLPNYSYHYSIIDKIKCFKDEKDYVLDDEHAGSVKCSQRD